MSRVLGPEPRAAVFVELHVHNAHLLRLPPAPTPDLEETADPLAHQFSHAVAPSILAIVGVNANCSNPQANHADIVVIWLSIV